MHHAPTITVVINNYNYEEFVGVAIRSVLSQTYPNVRCIVVDDGSTDGSREIIESFSGIQAVFKSNSGQAGAVRAGLELAAGEIVLFLDSDDYLFADACATLATKWTPDAAAIQFQLNVLRGGMLTNEVIPTQPFVKFKPEEFVLKYGYLPAAPNSGNAYSLPVARTIFANSINLHDWCYGCDTWLIFASPFFGRIVTVDRPLGAYRIHSNNASLVTKFTLQKIKSQIYHHYWAQQSVALFAAREDAQKVLAQLKGPYLRKWHLLTRHHPNQSLDIPNDSSYHCLFECCRQFLIFPGISLIKRIANCLLIIGYMALPLQWRTLLLRRAYNLDV